MAEIKPMALIESMSKKVCEHSDVYFRTNKKTGKVYTGNAGFLPYGETPEELTNERVNELEDKKRK